MSTARYGLWEITISGSMGKVMWMFDHIGLIEAHHPDKTLDIEVAALEAEAENVEPMDIEDEEFAVETRSLVDGDDLRNDVRPDVPHAFEVRTIGAHDPLEAFVGAIDGKGSDWADNHDSYLGHGHGTRSGQGQE